MNDTYDNYMEQKAKNKVEGNKILDNEKLKSKSTKVIKEQGKTEYFSKI